MFVKSSRSFGHESWKTERVTVLMGELCIKPGSGLYICIDDLTLVCVCLVDLLESFENHPPIVLPSAGFRVDLDSECVEDSIYRQLLYIRHYLWGLRTKTQTHTNTPSVHTHSNGTNTADWPDVQVRKTHTHTHKHILSNTHT